MDSNDLLTSSDPSIARRAHRLLASLPDDDPAQLRRRQQIAASDNVRRLLCHRQPDGEIHHGDPVREQQLAKAGRAGGAFCKWQGPHWTLAGLAELGYPPGDASLEPVVDQVLTWLLSPGHLKQPYTTVLPGQEDRVRRCASMEGMAAGMRRRGLITRTAGAGRTIEHRATPEGQRLLESASRFADAVFARTLGGLDPSQREELRSLLDLVLTRPLDEDEGA